MIVGVLTTDDPLVELNPAAGLHVKEVAPLALKVALLVAHTLLAFVVALTVGCWFTVSVNVTGALPHPTSSPVTVYTVVEAGLAVGVAQLLQFNPALVVQV